MSWANVIGAGGAITAAAISKGKKKGGSEQITPEMQDTRTPEQKAVDGFLSGFVTKYGPQYEPGKAYGGQMTAPMSRTEMRGDEFLAQYLDQPLLSPNAIAGQDYMNKSLTGKFDPGTSDFYAALRDESQYNRRRAIDQSRQDTGARGKFFSSEAIAKEGDINAQTAIGLNRDMAGLAENERQRQQQNFSVLPAFDKFITSIPLERATAAQTVGAYPRIVAQEELERRYKDFSRQQTELGGVVNTARGFNTTNLTESFPVYPQSTGVGSFLGPILQELLKQGTSKGGLFAGLQN
jgi:hypothetical protein